LRRRVYPFAFMGEPIALIGEFVTLIGDPIAFIGDPIAFIDERFIDAPGVMARRQPSMNCVDERALAASHAVARHYGDFSVMRKR
jgi:hypothetical protein